MSEEPMVEKAEAEAETDAVVIRGTGVEEKAEVHGRFDVVCIGPDGKQKWSDTVENVVCTIGKNVALDAFFAGAPYNVVGPFMGLISSVGWGAGPLVGDTMGAHGGWTEAGLANLPTYTAPRKTCAWNAAAGGAKSLSAALSFAITGAGTAKGCFLVYGAGAVNTIDSVAGTLYSAGVFTGGDKVLGIGDTLNVTYTGSM
jgi:hypothetical protein